MTTTLSNYTEESIQILDGLQAVRKRPGMYIGSTDARGLHHLVYEIVDNAIDEALGGFGDVINVTISKDNVVTVEDRGRGIPTGMHKSGRPTPEVIYTVLHAGGKFGTGGYKTSGGLHGVGASVVTALSEWVEVTIYRDGKIHQITFENGGRKISEMRFIGNTNRTGTKVSFKPDRKIFSTTNFKFETLSERLRESAFLLSGLSITINDQRIDRSETYVYEKGIEEFIKFINQGKKSATNVISYEGEANEIEISYAFQYTETYTENIISFVNNVRTRDGGSHETGLKSAFTRVINEYARKNNMIKDKDPNLEGADIREGLSTILSIRVPEKLLQFEGQTKNKLGTPEARAAVEQVVFETMSYFLNENPKDSEAIITKAVKAAQTRDAARKARDLARNSKKRDSKAKNLGGKLTPAQKRDPKVNELFIVEGVSAGGSAKQGRNSKFQAILPLRGKVINTEKASTNDIFNNEEINNIIYAIGGSLGSEFKIEDCNYDKIIIMTDADNDGAHIQTLLLTFFYRYMPQLVEHGKVYIAMPPLFKVSHKNAKGPVNKYFWSDNDKDRYIKRINRYTIQRYKGLGEMNADQLWDTTMNPEHRTLIRVNIDDASNADHYFKIIMGDNVELRREWIEKNVVLSLDDDIILEEV